MANSKNAGPSSRAMGLGCLGAAFAFVLFLIVPMIVGGFTRTDSGHVAVVRNGGWFSNSNIRQVIQPASSNTWKGLWTSEHNYPATQRFYTITADKTRGDRAGVDVVTVPSKDGVDMGFEGTLYFNLNLDPGVLKGFDNKFGTRTFQGADGKTHHAYDGDQGWDAFLDQIVRPVIDNDLRQEIGQLNCAQLLSSCALVQNGAQNASTGTTATGVTSTTTVDLGKIQSDIDNSLKADFVGTLGDEYLTNLKFSISKVNVPANVQDAINAAQAAYAKVSQSQAAVVQAQADAKANEVRQQGYNSCPTCALIDEISKLPQGLTGLSLGGNSSLLLK